MGVVVEREKEKQHLKTHTRLYFISSWERATRSGEYFTHSQE